jgi:hypothetical protein
MAEIEGFRSGDIVTLKIDFDGSVTYPISGMLLYGQNNRMDTPCWYFFHEGSDMWVDTEADEFSDSGLQSVIESNGYKKGWRLNDSGTCTLLSTQLDVIWYVTGSIRQVGIKGRKNLPRFTFKKKPLDFVN